MISNSLYTGAVNDTRVLDFHLHQQERTNWCWAAVIQGVLNYYSGWSSYSQENIVRSKMAKNNASYNRYANSPAVLDSLLQQYNLLNCKITGQVPLEKIIEEISEERVVIVRIRWYAGGGHFAVIYGFSRAHNNAPVIHISDPLNGKHKLPYADFRKEYMGKGRWTHTYFTKTV